MYFLWYVKIGIYIPQLWRLAMPKQIKNLALAEFEKKITAHVAARVRAQRRVLGLTQAQFSDALGVTYQQAHKYETGANRISAGRLYHIAETLGVSVGWFFEGAPELPSNAPKAPPVDPEQIALFEDFFLLPRDWQKEVCSLAGVLSSREKKPRTRKRRETK